MRDRSDSESDSADSVNPYQAPGNGAASPERAAQRPELPGEGLATACPLSWPEQQRNIILFACCTGLQYLAAPVLYVGITQASLCDRLGADARMSNLPGTLYFAMTAMPALIAWLSPGASVLKRNLCLCYAITAAMLGVMAGTLLLPVSDSFRIAMVVIQGGVSGAVMPAAIAFLWEAIGRGSDEARRGLALSLAFGVGPLLAVLGSLGQTALLGGNIFGLHFDGLPYPTNFVVLFGAGVPVMLMAAGCSLFLMVPAETEEQQRDPVSSVIGLLAGLPLMCLSIALIAVAGSGNTLTTSLIGYGAAALAAVAFVYHFRSLLTQRVLLLATLVTILVYSGNVIPSNMNLYSADALGDLPEKYSGVQNMLRFGFKVVAGLLLGLLLTKTNPRAGILATSTIFLTAQVWAIFVTGPWYLVAFGIHGAGELVGVYAPNYIVSASRRQELRRNMAFVTMLMVPAAPAGYLYGWIVDSVRESGTTMLGLTGAALGYRLSFCVCGLLILSGILLAVTMLPGRPAVHDTSDKS